MQLRAVTSAGDGPCSASASGTPRTAPGAPTIDLITSGHRTLTIAWSAPTDTEGLSILSYDLRHIRSDAQDRSDANWTVEEGVGSSSSLDHTVTGLTNGVRYDVQVRAANAAGNGPWSETGKGTPAASATPVFDEGAEAIRSVGRNPPPPRAGTSVTRCLPPTPTRTR